MRIDNRMAHSAERMAISEKCGKSGKGEKGNYVFKLGVLSRFSLPREMSSGLISLGSPV